MKICFPVPEDNGLKSHIYSHFGSAPEFLVVDTELGKIKSVSNGNRSHTHCTFLPFNTAEEKQVDALVVSSIGTSALEKFSQEGLIVYQALGATINDNITCMEQEGLPEFSISQSCRGY